MLVCGGAANIYVDCSLVDLEALTNDSAYSYRQCDRNVECVKTAGNSLWCTGPKMPDCYVYDHKVSQEFQPVAEVFNTGSKINYGHDAFSVMSSAN